MSQAGSSTGKKSTVKKERVAQLEEELEIERARRTALEQQNEALLRTQRDEPTSSESSFVTERSVPTGTTRPASVVLGNIMRELNKTISALPENINKAIKGEEMLKKDLTIKSLSMNFEEYQNYLGRISNANNYIYEQFSNGDTIDINIFDFVEEVEPGFKKRNLELTKLIEEYNIAASEYQSTFDMTKLLESIIELSNTIITPLPNIDPEIKKIEILKKIPTLPGTNNILFTKLKSEKKTSYDEILGDYIRLDLDKAKPCKLRYTDKDAKNPFYVLQGDKKFVFNNIGLAKNFCLSGGYQADFIGAKNQIDYEKKYKNQYAQSYILR